MSQETDTKTTRRDFLRNSAIAAVAAAGTSMMPTTAEGMRRVLGANDRISIGHIGVGTQGYGAHVRLIHDKEKDNNTQQIAVCDLYGRMVVRTQKELGLTDKQTYTEFRKLLENKDIDAVVVATSDNWHAPITIAALQAGKHVYCEKPMCKTLEENFAVFDAVKASKKIFQIGSQGTTDEKYRAVAKLIQGGKLGHLVVGQGNYMRGDNKQGEWNDYRGIDADAGPQASGEAHIDWETFRKGTQPAAWEPDRFFRWRKYWDYGSGLIGDLLPHKLHPLFIAMDVPTDGLKGFPKRVFSGGGLYVQKINKETGKPDREVPDFINVVADFDDYSMMLMSSCISEAGWPDSIRTNKAYITYSGDQIQVNPEKTWSDEIEDVKMQAPGNGEPIEPHHKNWFDCIRTNGVPNGNIDLAVRVQTVISLAERSEREGKAFTFDPKTRTATS